MEFLARVKTQLKRKRYADKLWENFHLSMQLATTDAVTGLYNRHYLTSHLETRLQAAQSSGKPLSVLMMDIDHFKKVNDTYGHPTGDAALRTVANTVGRAMRTEDVFARYGGEEFVGLLRGVALSGAAKAGERLRRLVEATPVHHEGQEVRLTVSVGAAALTCCEEWEARQLIAIADRRLYLAKKRGRNCVVADA